MASNQKIELKKGGQNVDGVFVPSITSNDLTSKPEFKIEPAKPPTKVPGMLGALESSADSFVENLTQKREQAQAEEEASFTSYLNAKVDAPTAAGLQASTYAQKGGVNDIEQELLGINQQIRAEQLGLRRQLERIDKNKGGGLASGLMAERNSAERESLAKQADLSVIQMGVQGRYDSAKAIADRAVDAQLEQSKNELEAMSLMYERNKDLFTQAEQREFETMQGDRNRKLEQEAVEKKTISDLSLDALQNGASPTIAAQMRQAKTVDDAMKIGGQYVGALDRAYKIAQINKIGIDTLKAKSELADINSGVMTQDDIKAIDQSPQGKQLQTASNLKLKLSAYQALVEKHGFETFGPEKATLENAYTELQLAYKEAANLGVLNGPDLTLVESAIRSATPGVIGNLLNIASFGGGTRNLRSNLEQAQTTLNAAAGLNAEQLYARNPKYRDSAYVQSILLPFGDELITSNEVNEMDAILNQP